MILHNQNRNQLAASPWYVLEVRSESTLDVILRSLGTLLRRSRQPIEVFVPLHGKHLAYGNYLFARGNETAIRSLESIRGLSVASSETLIPTAEGEEPIVKRTPIVVDACEVDGMIRQARAQHQANVAAIHKGSFVRVADGQAKGYCGCVASLQADVATVRVRMLSRTLTVVTPVQNLENLSHVSKPQQVYFYSEPIERMVTEEPEAIQVLEGLRR